MSNLWFRLMTLEFKIRDYRHPRANILKEVGVKQGFTCLTLAAVQAVTFCPHLDWSVKQAKTNILDANPLAIRMVKNLVEKNGLKNVETILSNGDTGLPNESLDVVLLYDVFHDLEDKQAVLKELHRVLKKDGMLSSETIT